MRHKLALLSIGPLLLIGAGPPVSGAMTDDGSARAFPHDDGVVEMIVTGQAARQLYDRMPGKGARSECGASGLHKGSGSISCTRDGAEHICRLWIDGPHEKLAPPEMDDC
ncbi:hypothetical protein [Sphingobium sp.]|uniref:hypothetical protein n=1 Tax=Sphingobium sp. TaxID=1912891 RepID=UPI003B3A3411